MLDGRPVGATNVSGQWVWDDGEGGLQIRALGYEALVWEGAVKRQTSNWRCSRLWWHLAVPRWWEA